MIAAGVGRLCVDVHLMVSGAAGRFDATKTTAAETRSLGGSVPWILAHLSQAGCQCRFIGPCGAQAPWFEARLGQMGVSASLRPVGVTNSYILYDEAARVQRIVGVRERDTDLLPAAAVDELRPQRFDWLVLDARHMVAAQAAAGIAHERRAGVMLDPGSTIGLDNLAGAGRALLGAATVLCTDTRGLSRIAGADDPRAAARVLAETGVGIVVHTGSRGDAELFAAGVCVQAEQLEDFAVGSTLGVGDAFRGWLLASLVESGIGPGVPVTAEAAARALRLGLAAAMARKADERLLPAPLRRDEVTAYLPRTHAR